MSNRDQILANLNNTSAPKSQTNAFDVVIKVMEIGANPFGALGGGAKSTVNNTFKNASISTSELTSINENVNEFVSKMVVKNSASCSSAASAYNTNTAGDVTIIGKNNTYRLTMESVQDVVLKLDCLSQSIQQTNISNEMSSSIMLNLVQKVDNNTLTQAVANSSAKQEIGFGANPFVSSNSEINLTAIGLIDNDTNRKLSNLVKNTVESNINISNIQKCFSDVLVQTTNTTGDVVIVGDENVQNVRLTTSQIVKAFAVCRQLVQQTSSITNKIVTTLGLEITDSTTNESETKAESTSSAYSKSTGLEGVIGALGDLLAQQFLISIISSVLSVIVVIIIVAIVFKGGKKKDKDNKKDKKDKKDKKK